ncbi:MAG: succinate dehydrogenase, cytochrome b556 subunit [Caulobacter sp.]|nr:succinate dehydrogenase, cytochrome b556 subunit [Caulobacter sp.]MDP1967082.1 succinate dehydrogenase, cytochrome b556 subunit [Reyranella sp.]
MTEASSGVRERPLSPHLQVWRWHVTMLGSILHRACLVGLYVGALILVGWAVALASGHDAYLAYSGILASPIGKLVLFGLTFALFFTVASNVRHLMWDTGRGFTPKIADMITIAGIAFALVATIVVWVIAGQTGALS